MTWALFHGGKAHLVKDSTVKQEVGSARREGWTYCGKITNTVIDTWTRSSWDHEQCKTCRRAHLKATGQPVPSRFKRSERT